MQCNSIRISPTVQKAKKGSAPPNKVMQSLIALVFGNQANVATIKKIKINHAEWLDVAVVEGLANNTHFQFLHRLCFVRQLHKLFCPECDQRILIGKLDFPVLKEIRPVLQHCIPCHNKGFVQIRFQQVIVYAPLDFFALTAAGTHPSLDATIQSVKGAPPIKLTADTAEYPIGERLLIRVSPHRA